MHIHDHWPNQNRGVTLGGVVKERKTGVHARDVYGGEIMFRLVTDCQSTQIVEMPLLVNV